MGVTLGKVSVVPEGLVFELKADSQKATAGFKDNLIIEVYREHIPKPKEGQKARERRDFINVIPAIPIQIISSDTGKKQRADLSIINGHLFF
jgi:hypothetical protein